MRIGLIRQQESLADDHGEDENFYSPALSGGSIRICMSRCRVGR